MQYPNVNIKQRYCTWVTSAKIAYLNRMAWIQNGAFVTKWHGSDRFRMSLSTTQRPKHSETFKKLPYNEADIETLGKCTRLWLLKPNEDKAKQLLVDHYEAKLKKVNKRRDELLAILAELKYLLSHIFLSL